MQVHIIINLVNYVLNIISVVSVMFIFQYSFTASEEDRNQVVVRVLQLLSELIKLGYYPDFEDIKDCLHAIMALLDGTEDFPDPSTKEGTHNIELKPRSLSSMCILMVLTMH